MVRRLGWGNHTVLKTLVDPEVVSLGRQIGNIDVRCNLVKARSKWHTPSGPITETPPDYPMSGLLYFEFQFRESKQSCLMSATIDITLKDADGGPCGETIFVKATYPGSEALKPDGALMEEVSKTRGFKVNPKANTSLGGAEVAEFTQESGSKSQVEKTWSFNSGRPSRTSDRAEFFWRRNTTTDWTGTDRGYDGALTLCRREHKDIILEVLVTITGKNNPHFGVKKTARESIGRRYGTSSHEKQVFDAWADDLPEEIRDRNRKRIDPRLRTSVRASSAGAEPGSTGTSSSES